MIGNHPGGRGWTRTSARGSSRRTEYYFSEYTTLRLFHINEGENESNILLMEES